MRIATISCIAIAALAFAGESSAKDNPDEKAQYPEVVRQMLACREVPDEAGRLKCYDRQVGAFADAAEQRGIVVADREELQKARRGLFGFTAPIGRLLGLGASEDKSTEIERIDTTVTAVGKIDDGWRLAFAEGGVWEQVDLKNFVMSPKIGQTAAIKKGALGSFFVSVNGQPGIKMRRVE